MAGKTLEREVAVLDKALDELDLVRVAVVGVGVLDVRWWGSGGFENEGGRMLWQDRVVEEKAKTGKNLI